MKKVLICDDEPHILESVAYVARKEGYLVLTAEDGETALRIAREERPGLVMLDLNMPIKSGYQVCEEIKSDPETRGTYVIMLTAKGQESDRARGAAAGADEYITKPFSPRKLRQRITEILGAA
ncbi:MAG TPA: response regulator [Patescibacteria group bacterium]|jgi:DNA-binding response OmpR family regulator|nr:response regulator [Patescibacteria group bacterium]